jgi:quercetin dioxygenase-like cupin family protein
LAKTPLHTHPWEHEVYVLRGEGIVVCEGKEHSFGPGAAMLVPSDTEHRFRNIGGGELAFICVIPNSGACVPPKTNGGS